MFIRIAPQFFNNESIVPAEKLDDCGSYRRLLLCYLEQPRNINVANLCSRCGLDSCQVLPPFDSIQRHDISRNIKATDKIVITAFHAGLAVSLVNNKKHVCGFILPGGSEGGAALDLARAVARRAERCAVAASQTGGVNRDVLAWMNRLSDLLYALARVCDRTTPAPSPAPAAPVMASSLTADGFCDQAAALCRALRLRAREQGFRVVAAVCDAGGNAVALQRDDDAYIASVDVASNKAFTAVSLKMTTEQVGRLAQPGAPLYGVQHTNQGRIVIFGGGAPLMRGGVIVGGLGVSGGSAEQDTALCDYGVQLFEKEMETLGF